MTARWLTLFVVLAVAPLCPAFAQTPAPAPKTAPAAPPAPEAKTAAPAAQAASELSKVEPPKLEPLKLDPLKADAPAADALRAGPKPDLGLSAKDDQEYQQEELGLGWALVRTVLVLGAVVALAYLTLNIGLRKLLGIRPQPAGKNLVTVLERVPLDQKRALFVVKAANEVLLIGGSENSLELIARLDAAEVEKARVAAGSAAGLQLSPFLQKLLGRKDAPPPPASS